MPASRLLPFLLSSLFLPSCLSLECFECSSFPREESSMDERLEPCPGKRPVVYGGRNPLYDACLEIALGNGTIVAQNAVIYSDCQSHYKSGLEKIANEVFGQQSTVRCCKGDRCNGPTEIKVLNVLETEARLKSEEEKSPLFFSPQFYKQDQIWCECSDGSRRKVEGVTTSSGIQKTSASILFAGLRLLIFYKF